MLRTKTLVQRLQGVLSMLPSLSSLDRRSLRQELQQQSNVNCLQYLARYGQTDIIKTVIALLHYDTAHTHGHAQAMHITADWHTSTLPNAEEWPADKYRQAMSCLLSVNPTSQLTGLGMWKLRYDKLDDLANDNAVLSVPGTVQLVVSTVEAPHENPQTARYSRNLREAQFQKLLTSLEGIELLSNARRGFAQLGPSENGVAMAEVRKFRFHGTPNDMYDAIAQVRNATAAWMKQDLELDVLIEDCNRRSTTDIDAGAYELTHTTAGILMYGINTKLSRLSTLNKEFLTLLNPEVKQRILRENLKRKQSCDEDQQGRVVIQPADWQRLSGARP